MLYACRPLLSAIRTYTPFLQLPATSRSLTTTICAMSSQPLQAQKCEPCTAALSAMSQDEAKQMLITLTGKWSLSPQPKTLLSSKATHPDALHRTYKFKDFTSAQAFANKLGALAEAEGHHPAIMVEWGRVTVWWWSHAINGVSTDYGGPIEEHEALADTLDSEQLHKNDFVMAAKTEELVHQAEGYTPPKPKA